jgi:hypothetical protein
MKGHALHNYFEKKNSNRIHGILWRWGSRPQHQQRKSAVRMQTAAAGPSNRNKPYRVDVRDSLEGTDSPGRLSICGIAGSANHGKIASMSCETGSFVTAICAPRKRAPDPRDRSGIFRIEKMSEEGICGIVKDDHRRQQVDRNV